ncbi:MAG: RnfABCDGE type electron transport complex subunit B [Gammaproteobacteria bacterium]|nr:RnfABCDGE type electron transport complex subunit B [Gammaproteobacteria bacterium]
MLIATLVISGLGIGLGLMLGVAARAFAVEENPLTKQVEQMMPGSQCGQCGFPGCSAAASAMVEGSAPVTCCPPGGRALAEKLASLLGVGLDAAGAMAMPMVAAIEEATCTGCTRCYRACPTDAIVGANGQIHVVLQAACTGCGNCAEACPEDCVKLQPESVTLDTWHWTKPQAA